MNVIVYTSITNNHDNLKLQPTFKEDRDISIEYRAYLDKETTDISMKGPAVAQWSVREAIDIFRDPKRNCQIHKVLSHLFIPEYDFSIWIDGSVKLKAPIIKLLKDNIMLGPDISLLWHSERDCIYKEAEDCLRFGLDDSNKIYDQLRLYQQAGYPEHYGLSETPVIIRKTTDDVKTFNSLWWSILTRYSKRDQLSFDFVRWHTGIEVDHIDGNIHNNDYFTLDKHLVLKEHEYKLDKNN